MSRKKIFFLSVLLTLVIVANGSIQVNAFYTDEETDEVQTQTYAEREEVKGYYQSRDYRLML